MKYARFSIAWADVEYDDIAFSEIRPVLILGGKDDTSICAKITSKPPRNNFHDIRIENSVQIGLPLLSTVRLDNLQRIKDANIHQRIGRLPVHDVKLVKNTLAEIVKEQKLKEKTSDNYD